MSASRQPMRPYTRALVLLRRLPLWELSEMRVPQLWVPAAARLQWGLSGCAAPAAESLGKNAKGAFLSRTMRYFTA